MPDCLVAAERRVRGVGVVAVRPHPARLDRTARAIGGVDVARPYAAPRPYSVSLAVLTASSKSSNDVTETTGPKISSWKIRIRLSPSKIVGWT